MSAHEWSFERLKANLLTALINGPTLRQQFVQIALPVCHAVCDPCNEHHAISFCYHNGGFVYSWSIPYFCLNKRGMGNELLSGHPECICTELGVHLHVFSALISELRATGYKNQSMSHSKSSLPFSSMLVWLGWPSGIWESSFKDPMRQFHS